MSLRKRCKLNDFPARLEGAVTSRLYTVTQKNAPPSCDNDFVKS